MYIFDYLNGQNLITILSGDCIINYMRNHEKSYFTSYGYLKKSF